MKAPRLTRPSQRPPAWFFVAHGTLAVLVAIPAATTWGILAGPLLRLPEGHAAADVTFAVLAGLLGGAGMATLFWLATLLPRPLARAAIGASLLALVAALATPLALSASAAWVEAHASTLAYTGAFAVVGLVSTLVLGGALRNARPFAR